MTNHQALEYMRNASLHDLGSMGRGATSMIVAQALQAAVLRCDSLERRLAELEAKLKERDG